MIISLVRHRPGMTFVCRPILFSPHLSIVYFYVDNIHIEDESRRFLVLFCFILIHIQFDLSSFFFCLSLSLSLSCPMRLEDRPRLIQRNNRSSTRRREPSKRFSLSLSVSTSLTVDSQFKYMSTVGHASAI
jgi:hypothetical protein